MGDTLRVTVVATGIEGGDDSGLFGGNSGYTNANELFGLGVRASASDNTPPLRNSVDDREPYRDDYAEPEQSGGFSLSSLLRKRTR